MADVENNLDENATLLPNATNTIYSTVNRPPPPLEVTTRAPAVSTPAPGWCSKGSFSTWLQLLTIITLLIAFIFAKLESDKRFSTLNNQYHDLQSHLSTIETSSNAHYLNLKNDESSIWDSLTEHQKQLTRLLNGTSNADVLDEMQKTKVQINGELEATLLKLEEILKNATNTIFDIRKNVTNQLVDLSEQVNTAQSTINEDVSRVKENIAQYILFTNQQFAAENAFVTYELAGLFTLLSCLIFLWHLTSHFKHLYKREVQIRIMGILWMVPVYGITSWLSMIHPPSEPYLGLFRDIFESIVINIFVSFLIAVLSDGLTYRSEEELRRKLELKLGNELEKERLAIERFNYLYQSLQSNSTHHGEDSLEAGIRQTEEEGRNDPGGEREGSSNNNERKEERQPITRETSNSLIVTEGTEFKKRIKPKEHFIPPLPCGYHKNNAVLTAKNWLNQCQLLAMQFVLMKPFLTIIPLALKLSGTYDIDHISPIENYAPNWHSPKLYIIILQNISVTLAFYGLLSFYHGVEKDLEWCEPWPKFLCVKAIVFVTFWQSCMIQMMGSYGLVDEKSAIQITNLLICIEMLIASIAHYYIFPYQEWEPGYQREKEKNILLRDTMAFGTFLQDMRVVFNSMRQPTSSSSSSSSASAAASSSSAEPASPSTPLVGSLAADRGHDSPIRNIITEQMEENVNLLHAIREEEQEEERKELLLSRESSREISNRK
jgi:hypothetical protein